jgi:hypothetical protein
MSHAIRSRISTDQDGHEVVASLSKTALKFVAWPFGIILAMRPQREREASRIAAEFRNDRVACDIITAPPSNWVAKGKFTNFGSVFQRFRMPPRDSSDAQAEAIVNRFGSDYCSDGLEREICQRLR